MLFNPGKPSFRPAGVANKQRSRAARKRGIPGSTDWEQGALTNMAVL